ncbi:hypothetical protein M9H77_34203 [Catharanthus roseus]|uniref:Uncharacterized protein n=1 Tax=Catharanthus roseus TaxID=4058 RepID=A0ACB9ZKT7_CATRO|nr:hypothetical protein M9H77_34203 [Catharanthus roseus]
MESNATKQSYLPEDIITEILLRLPVKSLKRFQCVAKRWDSMISNPAFAKAHLKITSENRNFTSQSVLSLPQEGPAFCTCSGGPGALCTCPLHSIEYGNSNLNLVQLDFPFVPPNTSHFCYMGFINGLSCWSLHPTDKIVLWNPSIRKFKVLPIDAPSLSSFGFGYDESTDDYKIIILTNSAKNGVPRMEVEIYSSKKKCSYKIDDYLDGDISSLWHGKHLSGSIYWIATPYNSSRDTCYIATLDMATDTFGSISMPEFDNRMIIYWSFELLGGCLSVIYTDFSSQLHVYTMQGCMMEQKWSRTLTVAGNYVCYSISPIVMYKKENSWVGFGPGFVQGYKDGDFECLEFGPFCGTKIGPFVESLISPEDMTN